MNIVNCPVCDRAPIPHAVWCECEKSSLIKDDYYYSWRYDLDKYLSNIHKNEDTADNICWVIQYYSSINETFFLKIKKESISISSFESILTLPGVVKLQTALDTIQRMDKMRAFY